MKTSKICTKCKQSKLLTYFNKRAEMKDGYRSECKACSKIYRDANKEEQATKDKEYRKQNRSYLLEKSREYSKNNKNKIAEYGKEYRKRPTSKLAKINRESKRRFKKKQESDGTIPLFIHYPLNKELFIMLEAQNYKCNECKCDISNNGSSKHLDHIEPLSKGGLHSLTNVQWLCATCNLSKGNKTPLTA